MTTSTLELTGQHQQRILLDNISWETYEAFVDGIGERQIRVTYDKGWLEIMTLSLRHESYGHWIGQLIGMLTFELNIPISSGGSTTLKQPSKKKGLEPDECYWIRNEARMRGKQEFSVESDPPPDLAVEVEIDRILDRMPIYAAFKVPEVWRFDGKRLRVCQLVKGKYREKKQSPTFPFLPLGMLAEFARQSIEQDETSLLRSFVRWIRSEIVPKFTC